MTGFDIIAESEFSEKFSENERPRYLIFLEISLAKSENFSENFFTGACKLREFDISVLLKRIVGLCHLCPQPGKWPAWFCRVLSDLKDLVHRLSDKVCNKTADLMADASVVDHQIDGCLGDGTGFSDHYLGVTGLIQGVFDLKRGHDLAFQL